MSKVIQVTLGEPALSRTGTVARTTAPTEGRAPACNNSQHDKSTHVDPLVTAITDHFG